MMKNKYKNYFLGLLRIIGVFILSITGIMLLFSGITLLCATILNLSGITNAPFRVGTIDVTGFTQILISLFIDIGLFTLSFLCLKFIRKIKMNDR